MHKIIIEVTFSDPRYDEEKKDMVLDIESVKAIDLKKIVTDAHMAGQHNQGIDASWSEALAYFNMDEIKRRIKMEEVKAYKTTDGMVYESKGEAIARQAKIDFLEWYDNNRLYGNCVGSYCDAEDLIEWIIENKNIVLKILVRNFEEVAE